MMTRRQFEKPRAAPRTLARAPQQALAASPKIIALIAAVLLAGCAATDPNPSAPPPRLSVAIHTCLAAPTDGFKPATDEAGQQVYVAELPFLTEADIQTASLVQSERRSMVQIEFAPPGADRLARLTAERRGVRLAIFIDDQLVMSPWVWQPITHGAVMLDGEFSQKRAKEIVQRLNNQRVSWRPPSTGEQLIEVQP